MRGTSLLWRSTKKFNPPSVFVYFRWSWSWSCYFGLGLRNLDLFISLKVGTTHQSVLERCASGCAVECRICNREVAMLRVARVINLTLDIMIYTFIIRRNVHVYTPCGQTILAWPLRTLLHIHTSCTKPNARACALAHSLILRSKPRLPPAPCWTSIFPEPALPML